MTSSSGREISVIVVGGGLAGLAAAHCIASAGQTVTVLEKEDSIREVGAGIQITPNVSRLLNRWGLQDDLEPHSCSVERLVFRRCEWYLPLTRFPVFNCHQDANGEIVGSVRPDSLYPTDAPYYTIHVRPVTF